ncbi:MAG: FkbM family methyltransferase [Pseudodesulfovibrio sp.]|nr:MULTISPECIES: FkbM family methyltransferase [Pseudodesulfovibrio]MBU4380448.1 FkbM family methyltransferase [Pseudomonadota bacterium]MBU4475996.1 FkbM family methyltransferase [Pseudomonadota bacterium]MBU4515769.1 FkbM family methyltransferase [Pseudomonadota bacterium]MBU4520765.1 FkbM family methyltransferase [Pseudomonadota bacterium]MBU4557639.1 FkbM family methyltransferase [Pseudomonadota bacterium]
MNAVHEVLLDDAYGFVAGFLKSLPRRPVVLDLGANIGCFALRIFSAHPDARVVSVEAASDTYAVLQKNIARNVDLDWQALHAGVWESDGVLHLDRGERPVLNQVSSDGDGDPVPALTVASLKRKMTLDSIDLIKMDIEGAENAVIPACIDDLEAKYLVVEMHRSLGDCTVACAMLQNRYPYALTHDASGSENPVYLISRHEVAAPGMSLVNMVSHLTAFGPQSRQAS